MVPIRGAAHVAGAGETAFAPGAVGANGFMSEEPTGNTSPSVVNQSAFLPEDASYCAV